MLPVRQPKLVLALVLACMATFYLGRISCHPPEGRLQTGDVSGVRHAPPLLQQQQQQQQQHRQDGEHEHKQRNEEGLNKEDGENGNGGDGNGGARAGAGGGNGGDVTPLAAGAASDQSRERFGFQKYDPSGVPVEGHIRAASSRMCLDAPAPGRVAFWSCDPSYTSAQMWEWRESKALFNMVDGSCLAAAQPKKDGPWRPVATKCTAGSKEQQWVYELHGSTTGLIQNVATGLCLTARLTDQPPFTADDLHLATEAVLESCDSRLCAQLFDAHALTPNSGGRHGYSPRAFVSPPHRPRQLGPPFVTDARAAAHSDSKGKTKRGGGGGPSILCWVMAHPMKLDTKAVAVNRTWGSQCDKLLFVVAEQHQPIVPPLDSLPFLKLQLGREESRETLWQKSKLAWKRVIDGYGSKYDWFLRADDDSYVVVDNLKRFLQSKDPNKPQYFGRVYKSSLGDFYSGGGGTVLSRAAMKTLADAYEHHPEHFYDGDTFADDMEICFTLRRMGVETHTSLDKEGRQIFLALGLEEERGVTRKRDGSHWIWQYDPTFKEGIDCCSTRWTVTHYIDSRSMFFMHDMSSLGCEAAGKDAWWSSRDAGNLRFTH